MSHRRRISLVVLAMVAVAAFWWIRHRRADEPASAPASSAPAAPTTPRAGHVDAAPATASGHVVRASDGRGIANAVVALAPSESVNVMGVRGDDDAVLVVSTDAAGAWTAPSVKPGSYIATATADGFLPEALPAVAIAAGDQKAHLDFSLKTGGTTVHGTVSDIGGGPIADAKITMTSITHDSAFSHDGAGYVATSGADGTYKLSLPDGTWQAAAAQPEYLGAHHSFSVAGKPVVVDFALTPGGSIRGQVVTRQGAPVPNATVMLEPSRESMSMFDFATATADATGSFQLRPVRSGAIELTAVARGAASASPTTVSVGIGEQIEGVRVVVDRAFSISGVVVDKDGHAIPGVHVGGFSFGLMGSASAPDPTDGNGAFEIIGVRPASYTLFAVGDSVTPNFTTSVEVVDKDVTDVKIVLSVGATLSGVVSPPVVASITIEMDQDKIGFGNMFAAASASSAHADSDATGAFTLHHVPNGEFSVVARTTDGRRGKLPLTISGDRAGLVVTLEDRASISGRVIDASGAPVTGARVHPVTDHKGSVTFSTSGGAGTTTGSDGAFRLVGLDVGTVKLRVSDDQGALDWADAAHRDKPHDPIAIEVATPTEISGVTLTVETRDGVIRGHVVDAAQQPVPDAWVTVSAHSDDHDMATMMMAMRGDGRQPVLTGADGAFVIDRLRHAAFEVSAEAANGGAHASKADVHAGDDITLVMATLGSLAGTVTSGGAPVATYDLDCTIPGSHSEQHVAAADGSYRLERMLPGSYTCRVDSDAGTATSTAVIADRAAHLDFVIGAWGSVTGIVVDASGGPMAGVAVVASTSSPRDLAALIAGKGPLTDGNGRFTVPHLAPGKVSLAVLSTSGFATLATRDIEVAAGQQLDVGTITATPAK